MNCYVGLSLLSPIKSISLYGTVLTQIKHFLALQSAINIIPDQNVLIVSQNNKKFYLSKNPLYLHTHLQQFIIMDKIDQQFIKTIIECLQIIKEHFPSKIEIEIQSECGEVKEWKRKGDQQVSRRLISQLKIIQEQSKHREVTKIEIEDIIYVLGKEFHKDYDQKLKNIALKILNEGNIDGSTWMQLNQNQIRIIDQLASKSAYQKQGIQVLEKIIRHKKQWKSQQTNQKQNISLQNNSPFSKPSSKVIDQKEMKSIIFQLKEGINLGRIVSLLQIINMNQFQANKTKLDSCVEAIGNKYLNDFYHHPEYCQVFAVAFENYWRKRGISFHEQMISLVYEKAQQQVKLTSNMEYLSVFEQ